MRYYADYYNNNLLSVGIGNCGSEITESEYNTLLSMIREKAALVDKLYSGEITLEEVPVDWKEEIKRRVNERIAAEGDAEEQEISGDEFLSMIEEVL